MDVQSTSFPVRSQKMEVQDPETISGKAWPSNNRGLVKSLHNQVEPFLINVLSVVRQIAAISIVHTNNALTSSHLSMIISAWSLHQTSQ